MERYAASGQTQRVFAREAGISVSSLNNWIRALEAAHCQDADDHCPQPVACAANRMASSARRQTGDNHTAEEAFSLIEVKLADGAKDPGSQVPGKPRQYIIELPDGTRVMCDAGFAPGEVRSLLALVTEVRGC